MILLPLKKESRKVKSYSAISRNKNQRMRTFVLKYIITHFENKKQKRTHFHLVR